jgi:radical SAM superfamily enzyme YgiQ (UPF0313 family)
MKITFIRPNMTLGRSADALPPLAFAVLAAHTPEDVETEFYDECIEEIPRNITTDLVAISAHTFSARRAYELADRFRAQGIPVVMGGYHPTFMPQEAGSHADAVVIGSAEGQWGNVVRDAKAGKLVRTYQAVALPGPKLGRYDMGLFRGKKYHPLLPIEFTRGCRFQCEFCTVSAFNRNTYTVRPVESVIREIKQSGEKRVFFVDDNILSDKGEAKKLFAALNPLKIKWGCQISIDVAADAAMLDLMARSGCILLMIGFETLRNGNLSLMRKGSHRSADDYAPAISRIKDQGIMIYASFMFGYDFDTEEIFDQTLDFAIRHKFALVNFNTLNPMPGSQLYARLKKEGRLIDEHWWLDEKFNYGEIMFIPKLMTTRQLKEGCMRARLEFNKFSGIFKRALDFNANAGSISNLAIFLYANLIARKEIKNKMKRIH